MLWIDFLWQPTEFNHIRSKNLFLKMIIATFRAVACTRVAVLCVYLGGERVCRDWNCTFLGIYGIFSEDLWNLLKNKEKPEKQTTLKLGNSDFLMRNELWKLSGSVQAGRCEVRITNSRGPLCLIFKVQENVLTVFAGWQSGCNSTGSSAKPVCSHRVGSQRTCAAPARGSNLIISTRAKGWWWGYDF